MISVVAQARPDHERNAYADVTGRKTNSSSLL